jgi:hypothetical protein
MRTYLGILGALTIIVIAFPPLIMLGFMFFWIPGLILYYIPSLFFISLLAILFHKSLWELTAWSETATWIGALVIVAAVLTGIPALCNIPVQLKIRELIDGDVTLAHPVTTAGTIVLHFTPSKKSSQQCTSLCERLLYSGTAKRVIMAEWPYEATSLPADKPLAAYTILRQDMCPPVPQGSSSLVADHALSGHCLIREQATLTDAHLMLSERVISVKWKKDIPEQWNLIKDTSIEARRLQLLEKSDSGWKAIDRKTQVEAIILAPVLHLAPIGWTKFGFAYKELDYNVYQQKSYSDRPVTLEDEFARLFGPDATKALSSPKK